MDTDYPLDPSLGMVNLSDLGVGDLGARIEQMAAAKQERDAVVHGFAHVLHERLMAQIADFEAELTEEQEVAAYLASFGSVLLIRIASVGYHNPYLIVFYGTNEETGLPIRLVQHCSQLNVLFTAVAVDTDTVRPARRIGFRGETDACEPMP